MNRSIEAIRANLWYGPHKVDIDAPKLSLAMSDDQLFDACVKHVASRVGSVASVPYLSRDRRVERRSARTIVSGQGWCVYVELNGYAEASEDTRTLLKAGHVEAAALSLSKYA